MADIERDWWVGLTVRPKYRWHDLYYERGEVVDVHSSGIGGIVDQHGVLRIRMESGRVLLAPAEEWVTA